MIPYPLATTYSGRFHGPCRAPGGRHRRLVAANSTIQSERLFKGVFFTIALPLPAHEAGIGVPGG